MAGCRPHHLAAQDGLAAAGSPHDEGAARLRGQSGLQAVMDLGEGPLPAEESLALEQGLRHAARVVAPSTFVRLNFRFWLGDTPQMSGFVTLIYAIGLLSDVR